MFRGLFWMFGFWAVLVAVMMSLMLVIRPAERMFRIPNWLDTPIIVGGFIVTLAIMVWLDCAFLLESPWLYPACRAMGVWP